MLASIMFRTIRGREAAEVMANEAETRRGGEGGASRANQKTRTRRAIIDAAGALRLRTPGS